MGATLNFNGGGAADAKISNSGTMTFQNGGPDFNGNQVGASAGNSTITNDSVVNFYGNCSAGSATIVNNVSGKVIFKDFCTADRATIKNNGLVDFSQLESATTTAGSFEGSGSVFLGSKGITVGANNQSTTFSGSIKDGGIKVSNGGSFGKNGTGTLTLSGDSNYTGGTVVTTGTLQIGEGGTGGSITGKVTDDSVLAFNRSNTLTFDGDISGKGSVQAIGTGTTILLGNNMYSGGTTINAGLISFSAANNLGTGPIILNGGGLQWRPNNNADISARLSPLGVRGGKFDTGGNDVAFATSLSGGGGLTKMGLRTLTLAMGNSYAGPTNVNGGTLRGGFANAFSRGSFTTVNADGTLELGGLAQTIDNVSLTGGTIQNGQLFGKITSAGGTVRSITGTSSLTTTGGSTIVLGDNSYPGGVTVSGGILQLGNGQKSAPSLEGNIMNNGMVAFQPYSLDTLTFGGNISGSGSVEQNGLGVTTLKGLNAYTGTITVKSGTLELYGPVASTNIQNAGTLKFLGRTAPSGGPVKAQIVNTNQMEFSGESGAHNSHITNNSRLAFHDQSSAGDAGIDNKEAATLTFDGNASAGSATIANFRLLRFVENSNLGDYSDIVNYGGARLEIRDNVTADSARIMNYVPYNDGTPGGVIELYSGGLGQTTVDNGGTISFLGHSSAQHAVITNRNDAVTYFYDVSSGGFARLINKDYGKVDFSRLRSGSTAVGSFEGGGDFILGSNTIMVGMNNLSTRVTGQIKDGVGEGGRALRGSFTKVGSGTLTLDGTNTYTGPTIVREGVLCVNGSISASSSLTVDKGAEVTCGGALPKTIIRK